MSIKTEMLRYFVTVARAGNLADAAKELGRTPSAISMMLKQLEENLGSPLFTSDRKKKLTALGQYVYDEAAREIEHYDQTIKSIMRFAESGEGQARLSSVSGILAKFMPDVVKRLHKENPGVYLEFMEGTQEAIINDVLEENVDLGICDTFSNVGYPNLRSVPILTDRYGILCLRDSPLGRKEHLHWTDLSGATIIADRIPANVDVPAVRQAISNAKVTVSGPMSKVAFVRAGLGLAIMTESVASSISQDLIFRVPEGREYFRTAFFIWNTHHRMTPAAIHLSKLIHEIVTERGMLPRSDELNTKSDWPGRSEIKPLKKIRIP